MTLAADFHKVLECLAKGNCLVVKPVIMIFPYLPNPEVDYFCVE